MLGQYAGEHTKAWAATIAPYDGYRLRHARVQPLHLRCAQERDRLPLRRVEQQGRGLRQLRICGRSPGDRAPPAVCSELQIAHVRQQLSFSMFTDFENFSTFRPVAAIHDDAATVMFDQLEAWAAALKPLRKETAQ